MNITVMLVLDIIVALCLLICIIAGITKGFPRSINKLLIVCIPVALFLVFLPQIVNTIVKTPLSGEVVASIKDQFLGSDFPLQEGATISNVVLNFIANLDVPDFQLTNDLPYIEALTTTLLTFVLYFVGLFVIVIGEILVSIVFAILRGIFRIKLKKMKKVRVLGIIPALVRFAVLFMMLFLPIYGMIGTIEAVAEPAQEFISYLDTEEDPEEVELPIEFGSYKDSYVTKFIINPVSKVLASKINNKSVDKFYLGEILTVRYSEDFTVNLVNIADDIGEHPELFVGAKSFIIKDSLDGYAKNGRPNVENPPFEYELKLVDSDKYFEHFEDDSTHLITRTELGITLDDTIIYESSIDSYLAERGLVLVNINKMYKNDNVEFRYYLDPSFHFEAFTDSDYDTLATLLEGDLGKFLISVVGTYAEIESAAYDAVMAGSNEAEKEKYSESIIFKNLYAAFTEEEKVKAVTILGDIARKLKNYNGTTDSEPSVRLVPDDVLVSCQDPSTLECLEDICDRLTDSVILSYTLPVIISSIRGELDDFGIETSDYLYDFVENSVWKADIKTLFDGLRVLIGKLFDERGMVNTDVLSVSTTDDVTEKSEELNEIINALVDLCKLNVFDTNRSLFNFFDKYIVAQLGDDAVELNMTSHLDMFGIVEIFDRIDDCDCIYCHMLDNGWDKELTSLINIYVRATIYGNNMTTEQTRELLAIAQDGVYAKAYVDKLIGADSGLVTGLLGVVNVTDGSTPITKDNIEDIKDSLGFISNDGEVDQGTVDFINDIASDAFNVTENITAEEIGEVSNTLNTVLDDFAASGSEDLASFLDGYTSEDPNVQASISDNPLVGALLDYLKGSN